MPAGNGKGTARSGRSGHDLMVRDVGASLAARAHGDAEPDDFEAAERHGTSRRSANRWRNNGRGSPVETFGRYLLSTPDPYRLVAHTKAVAKRSVLERLSDAELCERYREIRVAEKEREAADTVLDLTPGACWLDRAAASERDAALDEEKAAIERLFAERRLTEAEVFGR